MADLLNDHTIFKLGGTAAQLIDDELRNIPERYQKRFNSAHEGLGVLREEYIELETEIFFGEKKAKQDLIGVLPDEYNDPHGLWKNRIRKEAVQVAAMAVRIIQELT